MFPEGVDRDTCASESKKVSSISYTKGLFSISVLLLAAMVILLGIMRGAEEPKALINQNIDSEKTQKTITHELNVASSGTDLKFSLDDYSFDEFELRISGENFEKILVSGKKMDGNRYEITQRLEEGLYEISIKSKNGSGNLKVFEETR